jgi:hypothetical protein
VTIWHASGWQRLLSDVRRLLLCLRGLNPFVRRLIGIVRRLLTVEFSRELYGLEAPEMRFVGCKPLNSLENWRAFGILFADKK